MGWTKRRRARPSKKELLVLSLLPFLLLVATANAYEIEESSSSSESTEEYEQTDSYPPVEQGRSSASDVCEEEVQKWMCIDLVNSDSAVVSGPRVTDFPTVPDVKYEKLSQSIARVTHVYSEGYELMVPPNATIQVTCSQVKVQSPTFNCSHDYLMINSARFCNNNFPQAPFTFTSGNPGSQESMIVLKTTNPQRAAYSCQLQVVRRYPKRVIDLIKHVEFTLDVSGKAYRQETDFVILAPKKSFVVMSCPVFEVSDYWPCKQSYVTVDLEKYCHFPTAHKVEIEIPPTGTAAISVKLASSPNDRVQCVLHRIAGKKTACVESPNTPTYVGAPEQRAQICVNMVASPIVKIVSPFRDEMETEMDMTVRYEVMSVPHMVHYLWCNDFRLDTDCSKERLHWFNYNDRLCGHSRPRDFTYSYGHVKEKATYSLTYKKQRGVRQGHFSCFLYREPQSKGTYTLDLFSKNSATIEKHSSKRIFPHDSQVITYYVLAPPDSEVVVTCSDFNIQSGPDCSNSYLKINDRQYCDSNVPGRQRLELTYNYAVVTFRDGKDASNSFSCTFERGSSTDKCAFERKQPTTTLSPWETISTTESSVTETPFSEEGVTTEPSATTLITPFTEEATVPWYNVGSTTLRTLKYTPSATPEEGATFSETPFPGASTEYPTESPLFPQQQATGPSLPVASIAATTEVGLPPEAASPSTGLVPTISQSVSPAQLPSATSLPHEEASHTLPPEVSGIPTTQASSPHGASFTPSEAVPSRPFGISVPETFPAGASVFPTTQMSLPPGVPSEPSAFIPTMSNAATAPETITTATPFEISVVPTTEVSLPTGASVKPNFIPSVSMGSSLSDTVTPFPALVTQKGIPTTSLPGISFIPTGSVSFPSSMFSQPATGIPSVTGGLSVPVMMTGTPVSFPHEEVNTSFPPGLSVAPTTEVSFPSGVSGEPSLIVPSVSMGISVPEITGTPPSVDQKESTATIPSGMSTVPTSETSVPSFMPGSSMSFRPTFSPGVSFPGTLPVSPQPTDTEGSNIIPSTGTVTPTTKVSTGVSVLGTGLETLPTIPQKEMTTPFTPGPSGLPTTEVSLPSGAPSQPTAVVPSVSQRVSVPGSQQTGSQPSFPYGELTTTFPSGPSGIPTMEVPTLSGVPGQPTAIVPSVSVDVSVPETGASRPSAFPQEEITTTFPTGPSGLPNTEVSIPSGIPGQTTGIVPSISVGVSVPETQTGSQPSFPYGELTTPLPSGPTGVPTLSGAPGQPTAIVPSVSVGVSVPEAEGSRPPAFSQEGFTTPFPTGPSGLPTTEVSIPSGISGQPTGIAPSVSVGVSVPETQTGSPPSFPLGELTTPLPSGPSGIPTFSGAPGQPTAIVPSVSVGVSVPEAEASPPQAFLQEGLTTPFPTGPSGLPTTEVSIPSGIPGQPTGIIPSVSVGVSVPETQTSSPPSFPQEGLTVPFQTGPSGLPTTEVSIPSGITGQPTGIVPSVSVGVSVPETQTSSPPSFSQEGLTVPFQTGPSGLPTTEVSIPSGITGQPTGIVPSVSVGVSVPETQTSSPPSFSQERLTVPFQTGPSGLPTTEVSIPSGITGQPTGIVSSVSVGVSVPETQTISPPSFPKEGLTVPFQTGPSGLPTTELSIPSGIPSQPTGIVPSVSVGVSVPETQTSSPLSVPLGELTTPFPSGPSGIPNTEAPTLSGAPGQPTAIVPSVSVGVSVPETEASHPTALPQEGFTTPFPTGPSGLQTTEVSIPSGIPGQPTGIASSVSLGVSVPDTQTGSQPSFPYGELTTAFPSGPSGIPITEVPTLPGGPGQPTGIAPSVSLGVSVPETQTGSQPSFPYGELTTPFPSGPSGIPNTEVPTLPGVSGQPTSIVPSVSVGVSVPETEASHQTAFPQEGLTTPFPTGPSGLPTTEVSIPSGIPGQPTGIVPSVSVGVSVPETQTGSQPSFPYGELTTPFPSGPSGMPNTEVPTLSGGPGQPTGIAPSVSLGVSVPETQTGSQPSFPYGELTTPFPSGPSGIPNTEVPTLPGVSGQPTAIVPSVSVGVSVPETEASHRTAFPQEGLTTPFPTGPSGLPTTEVSISSGIPGQPTGIVPSVSVGVSVPETQTGSQPSFPYGELTTSFPSGPSGIPNTEVPTLSGVPGQPTAIVPSVSVGVSVPETQTSSPPAFPHEELTTPFPSGPSGIPTTEVPTLSGAPGQPTVIVPSVSMGVSVPEKESSGVPSFPYGELTTPFPSGPSGVPTTEGPIPSGVPGEPTAAVPSVSVGGSVPETQTGSQPSFPQEEFTTPFSSGTSLFTSTEKPMPSSVPGQPTVVVPSVSVGASVPETSTTNPEAFPNSEFTAPFPSASSIIPTAETSIPSGVPSQPSEVVPSVSVGVSVPGISTASPESFPHSEFTTPFSSGPSLFPTNEKPMPSGAPGESTTVVPTVSVGISGPETSTANPEYFPNSEFPSSFPSGSSFIPTTEESIQPGIPGQTTAVVPSVSVGVSVPETGSASPPSFPYSQLTTPFPSSPSGLPTTELPKPTVIPGQSTAIPPSVSVPVSVPETVTSASSLPHGELTTAYPPQFSVLPTSEISMPSGVSGLPTVAVPSVPVGVSGPQAETRNPPFGTPGFTATLPSGAFTVPTPPMSPSGAPGQPVFPSGVSAFPTTEVPFQSGASIEQSTVVPSVSLGVSIAEGVTSTQPTFSEENVSGTGASFPTTELSVPSNAPFNSTLVPPMSGGVSVPGSPSYPVVTGTLPSAMSVVPTSEVSLPRGGPGEPTAIVPSATVGVSLPGPSSSPEEYSSTFPSGGSAVPTTEVSLPSGITGLPSVAVPSFSVGVSMPETATSTAGPLTVETRTLPSGFPVSETMPGTPAPWPSSLPHGTPGAPTTPPFGSPSISSGPQPSLPEGISVESETGTPAPSEELHDTTQPFIPSAVPTTNVGFPSGPPRTHVSQVPEAYVSVSVPPGFVPTIATATAPSFYGTKVANDFTSTPMPYQTGGVTGPEEPISTTLPPSLITPETEEIRILLMIIRTDLRTYKVNATVLHTFLIKATTIGSHDAYTIILLALKDIKLSCKYLAPAERIKVAYEIAHYLKSHGTRIAHDVVVKAVGVFLCAVDHKDIITKLLSENTYMISISESVASELSCPDMEHLIHLLYADRNRTKVEESPCAGILCEEVPENVMDTIDMLVDRYFPQKAHEKKWLMLDIAKALNLQPEEDEEGDEMVYYKMGDYDVFLEELREPTISDEEMALLFGKFFAEVRKVAKAERKLRLDDLEEVWKMGGGKLPQPAVRSFIALLKLVHSKRISLKTEERIRLLKLALKCDGHECTKLSSSDIHNLIFALCNVGIRDGFGLPKDLKSQVTKFILTLKDNYIDSISIRRWKRSSSLLKPKSHDYLSASSPSELRYLKDWLQKPMSFNDDKGLLKNTGRSNDDPSGNKKSVLSQLYNAYVSEKRPDIKTVLAERLLDTYNTSFKHLGAVSEDTEKFVLSVVQQLPSTTSRHNDLILGILEQCIRRGDTCLNVSSSESIAPLKVIMQNMSLKQSPNFVRTLSRDLFAAAKKARTHVDLSWLTDNGSARKISQTTVPQVLQVSSRASTSS